MNDETTPAKVRFSEGLGPLVACPLCGADNGYLLTKGSTYRWWLAQCKHCGDTVAECASDRRTAAGTVLPDRWPAADQAWNAAGAHAHMLRSALRQVAQAHAWLAFGECRSFGADVPLLTPSDADALAHFALGEYREGPRKCKPMPSETRQGAEARKTTAQPAAFVPLQHETRPAVDTDAAAHYLNRRPQTLRSWACKEDGPLRPVRVNSRLAWPVAEIRRVLGVK